MCEGVRIAAGPQFLSVALKIIFLWFLSCISVFFSEVESSWIDLDAHIIVQDSWKRT
jgi:hypothetical protein